MGRPEPIDYKSSSLDDVLAHFGVKGMKWGVRRRSSGGGGGAPHPSSDHAKASAAAEIAKRHGTSALSNQELQHLVNRMNLEKRYADLGGSQKKGRKFVANLLQSAGHQQASRVAGVAAAVAVSTAMAKAASKPGANPLLREVSKKLT